MAHIFNKKKNSLFVVSLDVITNIKMSYVNVISRWQIMHFFNFVDFRNSCKRQQCSNFTYVISHPKHCRQVTQKRIRILQSKITSFSYVHKQYIIIMHHISECDLQDAITYLTCCISHVTMLFNLYDKNTQWFNMDVKRHTQQQIVGMILS